MMEAVCISETLVNLNVTTLRYIPEDSKTSYSPPWEPEISQAKLMFATTGVHNNWKATLCWTMTRAIQLFLCIANILIQCITLPFKYNI
jgi:hypothetical protein